MTCRSCGFFLQSFSRPQTSDSPVGAWWPFIQRPQLCLWGVAGPGGQGAHPAAEPCPALGPLKTAVTGHSVHGSKQHSVRGVSFRRPKRVAGSRGQVESHRVRLPDPPDLIPQACRHHSEASVKHCSSLPIRPASPVSSMSPCVTRGLGAGQHLCRWWSQCGSGLRTPRRPAPRGPSTSVQRECMCRRQLQGPRCSTWSGRNPAAWAGSLECDGQHLHLCASPGRPAAPGLPACGFKGRPAWP